MVNAFLTIAAIRNINGLCAIKRHIRYYTAKPYGSAVFFGNKYSGFANPAKPRAGCQRLQWKRRCKMCILLVSHQGIGAASL